MIFNSLISFLVTFLCLGLASFVFFRDRHSLVHRAFTGGMIALALEAFLNGLSFHTAVAGETIRWQQLRMIATAFLPGTWLLFAVSFGRANDRVLTKRYRWVILGAFVLPLLLAGGFKALEGDPFLQGSDGWIIGLSSPGDLLYVCLLVAAVLILMNLVETLRSSVGRMRWQIKFTLLGIGGIFAFRIYSGSQTLLFHAINSHLEMVNILTAMVAVMLVSVSLTRLPGLKLDIYFSPSFLYGSVTVIIAGMYFVAVGALAKVLSYFRPGEPLYVEIFLVFLAFVGLSILFLSERVRGKLRRFVNLNLKQPHFDYRKEWIEFTQASRSVTDAKDFCAAIAVKISKTFHTFSATIWLVDETSGELTLGASTVLGNIRSEDRDGSKRDLKDLLATMREHQKPLELSRPERKSTPVLGSNSDFLDKAEAQYCIPLSAGGNLVGLMTLGRRVTGGPYSWEDLDLLTTIADQTAGILLNLRLFEDLRKAKEMEAIQRMSAFMVHDLKNLASMLSLTTQNMTVHLDNPEFRKDAATLVQQSVSKIEEICHRLSSMSQKIELKRSQVNLNDLVRSTLSSLNGVLKTPVVEELHSLPQLTVDPEQIQKVLTNLVLNANEATGGEGKIRITTRGKDGWAILSVSDTGCGMSKEFMEKRLFRPFETTKKKGMGIGLYHSRMIVEAHQGRIEVESEEGKGSTFRILLPMEKV